MWLNETSVTLYKTKVKCRKLNYAVQKAEVQAAAPVPEGVGENNELMNTCKYSLKSHFGDCSLTCFGVLCVPPVQKYKVQQ